MFTGCSTTLFAGCSITLFTVGSTTFCSRLLTTCNRLCVFTSCNFIQKLGFYHLCACSLVVTHGRLEDRRVFYYFQEIKNQKHVVLLQNKEEKLLHDRRELEKKVNNLTSKIRVLEGQQQRKSTSDSRSTKERGSQTDLVSGVATTAASLKKQPGAGSDNSRQPSDETSVRKCKGIVKSLGKFFEQLVQNPDDSKGSTRGRRTAVAARRATELLHELSISMEQLIVPKGHGREGAGSVSGCSKREPGCSGDGRKNGANTERTLWDNVSHEVAHHEFAFEQTSPTSERQGTEAKSDKENEVQRAEKGLHKLYQCTSPAGDIVTREKLTKGEASKLMEANRKQTEMIVREILSKVRGAMEVV